MKKDFFSFSLDLRTRSLIEGVGDERLLAISLHLKIKFIHNCAGNLKTNWHEWQFHNSPKNSRNFVSSFFNAKTRFDNKFEIKPFISHISAGLCRMDHWTGSLCSTKCAKLLRCDDFKAWDNNLQIIIVVLLSPC
jgi:hypothetical protein